MSEIGQMNWAAVSRFMQRVAGEGQGQGQGQGKGSTYTYAYTAKEIDQWLWGVDLA
jgi:hypothetical protein